jgi:hypothetical protein
MFLFSIFTIIFMLLYYIKFVYIDYNLPNDKIIQYMQIAKKGDNIALSKLMNFYIHNNKIDNIASFWVENKDIAPNYKKGMCNFFNSKYMYNVYYRNIDNATLDYMINLIPNRDCEDYEIRYKQNNFLHAEKDIQ